jgi:phosphopantetheinyl transferase
VLTRGEIHVRTWPRAAGREPLLDFLGVHLGRSVSDSSIARTPLGQPYLPGRPFHFSVSHSGPHSAVAVSLDPVGLDIERMLHLADLDDTAAASLGPLEARAFAACEPRERERFFYRCWTRKEALLKAMGCGLSVDPREADTLRAGAWHLHEATLLADCAACVASPVAVHRVAVSGHGAGACERPPFGPAAASDRNVRFFP